MTLSTADDKGSPPEAVAAAAKLAEQDKVELVTAVCCERRYRDAILIFRLDLAGVVSCQSKPQNQIMGKRSASLSPSSPDWLPPFRKAENGKGYR